MRVKGGPRDTINPFYPLHEKIEVPTMITPATHGNTVSGTIVVKDKKGG